MNLVKQISNSCIHSTSKTDKVCKAGIKYEDVKDTSQKPYRWPCHKEGPFGNATSVCPNRRFPTTEEVDQQVIMILELESDTLELRNRIQTYLKTFSNDTKGEVECTRCNRSVDFIVQHNGHVWARCRTESCLSFQE